MRKAQVKALRRENSKPETLTAAQGGWLRHTRRTGERRVERAECHMWALGGSENKEAAAALKDTDKSERLCCRSVG